MAPSSTCVSAAFRSSHSTSHQPPDPHPTPTAPHALYKQHPAPPPPSQLLQVGQCDEALAQFREMLQPGSPVRPTASTFNTVMSMFMRQGQCDKVGPQG